MGNNTVLKVLPRTWNVRINVKKGAKAIRTTNIIGGRIIPACYRQQKHFLKFKKPVHPNEVQVILTKNTVQREKEKTSLRCTYKLVHSKANLEKNH